MDVWPAATLISSSALHVPHALFLPHHRSSFRIVPSGHGHDGKVGLKQELRLLCQGSQLQTDGCNST